MYVHLLCYFAQFFACEVQKIEDASVICISLPIRHTYAYTPFLFKLTGETRRLTQNLSIFSFSFTFKILFRLPYCQLDIVESILGRKKQQWHRGVAVPPSLPCNNFCRRPVRTSDRQNRKHSQSYSRQVHFCTPTNDNQTLQRFTRIRKLDCLSTITDFNSRGSLQQERNLQKQTRREQKNTISRCVVLYCHWVSVIKKRTSVEQGQQLHLSGPLILVFTFVFKILSIF